MYLCEKRRLPEERIALPLATKRTYPAVYPAPAPPATREQPPTRELQRMSVQVEHVDDEIGVQVEPVHDQNNDVADDDAHDVVQQTAPIL